MNKALLLNLILVAPTLLHVNGLPRGISKQNEEDKKQLRNRKLMGMGMGGGGASLWAELGEDVALDRTDFQTTESVGGNGVNPLEILSYCIPFEEVIDKADPMLYDQFKMNVDSSCCVTNSCGDQGCCRVAQLLVFDQDDELGYLPCVCNDRTLRPPRDPNAIGQSSDFDLSNGGIGGNDRGLVCVGNADLNAGISSNIGTCETSSDCIAKNYPDNYCCTEFCVCANANDGEGQCLP